MKRKRRLFGIVLIITALILMQLPVAEADAATSASDFKMEGNILVKYRGTEKNVSVPDTVEVIGEDAFAGNTNIELVVLPKSVKEIEAYAFWGCENLESVILGKGLTEVGDYAFTNCKGLQKMSIPSNISSIGIKAFADCVNLTDITIAPEVTRIHETSFDGCYKLLIHCEAGTVADSYADSFYERQKEMPEYEDVSDYPSADNSADKQENQQEQDHLDTSGQEVVPEIIGETIGTTQVVGNQAVVFIDNTSLHVQNGSADMEELKASQLGENTGSEDGICKYTIVDDAIVADQAYYRNQGLQKVVLQDGIEEIGQFAFARSSITEIVIPEGTKKIGFGAFYHCDELTGISLPETIENVEPRAFDFTDWVEEFRENGTEDFLMNGGVLLAYRGNEKHLIIPEGVRVIAGEVFAGHSEIEEVTLPDSVRVIGEGAFSDCSNLNSISFGSQVKQIKDRAFFGCRLSSVVLPSSVEEIGIRVFDDEVQVQYAGNKEPRITHELSAERLSNEVYRGTWEEQSTAGVTVSGIESATAYLEGADRSYTLLIEETSNKSAVEKAFLRNLKRTIPDDMILYELHFTDQSGIPITKLGKQYLEVTLPIPENLVLRNLALYALDRNGQLEKVSAERIKLDGIDCLRFKVYYVSCIGVVSTGTTIQEADILEETTNITSLSAAPAKASQVPIQLILGIFLLIGGMFCVFWKKA